MNMIILCLQKERSILIQYNQVTFLGVSHLSRKMVHANLIGEIFFFPYLIVGLLDVSTNAVLIHILRKLKKLQTISYRFIWLQSISDICTGLTLMFTAVSLKFINKPKNYVSAEIYMKILCNFFCQFSIIMLLVIAIDRYLHMTYSSRYASLMTINRAKILVAFNACICLCVAILQVLGVIYGFYNALYSGLNIFALVMVFTASVLYFKAYRAIKRFIKHRNIELDSNRTSALNSHRNPTEDFARAVLCILACTTTCYFPHVLVVAFRAFSSKDLHIAFHLTRIWFCIFPSINAVVFIWFNRKLKIFVMLMFNCNDQDQRGMIWNKQALAFWLNMQGLQYRLSQPSYSAISWLLQPFIGYRFSAVVFMLFNRKLNIFVLHMLNCHDDN